MRTRLGKEGSEKTTPDVEALERQISHLRGQLDTAAQIIITRTRRSKVLTKIRRNYKYPYNELSIECDS